MATSAAMLALIVFGHYTRREHVQGILVPTAGLSDLAARTAGTVEKILVHEGDYVTAGQPILVLSGERSSETHGNTNAGVTRQLSVQQDRLRSEIQDELALRKEQGIALDTQEASLTLQISRFDKQIEIVERQVASNHQLLDRIKPLASKGYVSAFQLQQQEDLALSAEAQVADLRRQRETTVQQLGTVRDQKRQVPLNSEGKVEELNRQLAQAEQLVVQNEADRATVITAGEDALVSSIVVNNGQTVQQGQHLASLVPKGSVLVAQMLVPSSAIGFVKNGTRVSLHYQAFPFQKFGVQYGKVIQVSRSALSPTAVTEVLGDQKAPDEALYRVQVSLEKQSIQAYGKDEGLRPGMAIDADILLDRRRLIEWIFEPIYGMRKQHQEDPTHA